MAALLSLAGSTGASRVSGAGARLACPACPACGGGDTAQCESAEVGELAAAWARQPHLAARGVERLAREIRADLGATRVRFLRCGRCGLEFADPMRAWSAGHYPDEIYGLAFDQLRALEWLRDLPAVRLLELGCAEGAFLQRAAARGHRVTGLDFNAQAVAQAAALGLDARVGDVAELRASLAAGDRFGVVAMFQLIEHLADPDAVLEALAPLCAPGARLLVGCPSDRRYSRKLSHPERVGSSDFWDWPPQHTLRWSETSLRTFLERHGWRVTRVEHEPFTIRGAAAHLVGLRTAGGEPRGRLWRGWQTLRARLEVAALRARGSRMTGVRLLLSAQREAA
jgi:2-polyprenyl-3-methyl-5-hydroxy-6-metoxy-1,4-benzoquinol methylase